MKKTAPPPKETKKPTPSSSLGGKGALAKRQLSQIMQQRVTRGTSRGR